MVIGGFLCLDEARSPYKKSFFFQTQTSSIEILVWCILLVQFYIEICPFMESEG